MIIFALMESCNKTNGARVKSVFMTRFINPQDKTKHDSMSLFQQNSFFEECLNDGRIEMTEVVLEGKGSEVEISFIDKAPHLR